MKKVQFLVSTTVRAGPTKQLLNLCKHLPEFGYNPSVLTLSPDPVDSLGPEFGTAGIEVESLEMSRIAGALGARRRILSHIQMRKPDILHTSGIRSDALGLTVCGLVPHVLTVRNIAWDDYPKKFGRLRGSLMAIQHLRTIRRAQHVVACSNSIAERLSEIREDIRAIPNGVDTVEFQPAPQSERDSLSNRLGLSASRRLVISVGALISRKQPEQVLQAFLSSELYKSADLIFLGDGPLREKLEGIAGTNPRIRILGQVDNVIDYLRTADVFVSASMSEGLPNSALEALACGVPCVLSNIAAHRELGLDESGAGRIAALNDPNDIARQLSQVAAMDKVEISNSARELVERRYSASIMTQRYAALYVSL